jgi:predicted dehydrogenase
MKSDIGAAVVGVGFIGVAHIEALRRIGVEVIGVVGSSPGRAKQKANAANLPPVFSDLETALGDPDVDVVHVATPNHLHAEHVRAVLDAGKHVVCEKPLALDTAETADLLARAEASGKVHAVCFNIRFYPLCHQAEALVRTAQIGRPLLVHGGYVQDWLLLETDWNWRLESKKAGRLRAVADIGSHWLDLARFVTGQRITEVMADLHTLIPIRRHPPGPVETFAKTIETDDLIEETMTSDDAAGVLLRFEEGARGVLPNSQISAGRKNSLNLEVDGSAAALSWYSEDPDRLWIGHRGRPNEIWQRDPALATEDVARLIGYPGGHVEGYPDTFRALFAEVYAAVAEGRQPENPRYPTFADGHDTVAVTEAVARSSDERRWVKVER